MLLASSGYTWRQVAELPGVPAGTVAERLRDGLLSLGSTRNSGRNGNARRPGRRTGR